MISFGLRQCVFTLRYVSIHVRLSGSIGQEMECTSRLQKYLEKSQITKAFLVYDQMKTMGIYPTKSLLNELGVKIGLNKQKEKALELLRDIPNEPLIYFSLIDGFCMSKNIDTAIGIFNELKKKRFAVLHQENSRVEISRAFESIIICSCKLNDFQLAIYYFEESQDKKIQLNTNVYNSILRICYRHKKYHDVLHIYNSITKNMLCTPDTTTINILFQVYKDQKENSKILDLVEEIRKYSIVLDIKTLQDILKLSLELGKTNSVLEILELINKNSFYNEISSNDQHNIIDSFNIIIYANCAIKNISGAFQTFKEMREQNILPNVITFQHIIEGARKTKQFDLALQLFDEMKKLKIFPNSIIYSRVIEILCVTNQIQVAQSLFDEFVLSGLQISIITYNILIRTFCRLGDIEKALLIINNMKENGIQPNISTVNNVMEGFCKYGSLDEALFYLENERNRGLEPNLSTYEIIFCSCIGKPKRLQTALRLLDEFKASGRTPNSILYLSMIQVCYSVKSYKLAISFWEEAKQINQHVDVHLYNIMISVYCSYLGIHKALELIEEMKLNQITPTMKTYYPLLEAAKNNDELYKNIKRQAELFTSDQLINK